MNLLLDTSVWVEHLRRGILDDLFPALRRGWMLMLDATVASELLAGCRSKRERRVVDRLRSPFERAGRLVTPENIDFRRAALAISRLREQGVTLTNPGAALLDGIIASCAVKKGALLVTFNEDDFVRLATKMPLLVESFEAFVERFGDSTSG